MKVTIVTIVIGASGIIKGTGGLGSWRPSEDHPNDSIIKNGQNIEKSPGDLRRLAVTQTPVKNHQLMLMWKTKKKKKNSDQSDQPEPDYVDINSKILFGLEN